MGLDSSWWFFGVLVGSRLVYCGFWGLFVISGGYWWFLDVFGVSLLFLVVLCDFWSSMVIFDGP